MATASAALSAPAFEPTPFSPNLMIEQISVPVTRRAVTLSRIHVIAISTLLVLSLLTLSRRLYIKVRPVLVFGWDDGFIVAAMMFAIANAVMLMYPWAPYMRRDPELIITASMFSKAGALAYLSIMLWAMSMASIKISVALTLLRFFHHPYWRMFLYVMISLQAVVAIATAFWLSFQCRPIYLAWALDPPPDKCASPGLVQLISNLTSAFNILTDVILSLLPLQFIVKLHRPVKEKILLGALMAVGLMACIASVLKTIVVTKFGRPDVDLIETYVSLGTWTAAEELLGILAACLPSMKMPLQRGLARLGLPMTTVAGTQRTKMETQKSVRLATINRKDTVEDDKELLDKEFEAAMKDNVLLSRTLTREDHNYSTRGRDEPFDIGMQGLKPFEPV